MQATLLKTLTADVTVLSEPILSWSAECGADAVCVDIDAPDAESALSLHHLVDRYFPETLPRPLFAYRSHGGGLKAVFVSVGGVPAIDLAAAWYVLAPLGVLATWRAEVKRDLRHPRGLRERDGASERCGPLAQFSPSARLVLPRETAAEASASDVADWLQAHDLEMGRRSAANCPMPGCGRETATSGSDPIDVSERGIRCFRCSRFERWGSIVYGAAGLSALASAARERVHFGHQRYVLRHAHPKADESLLRQGWWVLLHAGAQCFPPPPEGSPEWEPYAKARPAFAAAMSDDLGLVRGVDGSWLQAGTLRRRMKLTTITARALPWVSTPSRVDEALDVLPLAGFQPVYAVNHGLLLPPRFQPPEGALLVRRGPVDGELAPVDVSRRPSPLEVEAAWVELERLLPGLDRGYLSALVAAALRAHDPTGVPPMAVVTGGSGAGKNTTLEIAASIVGTRVAGCKLSDPKETLRDFGLALEDGSTILNVNEVGRTPAVYAKLEALLRIGATLRFDAKHRNEVTVPFRAAIVITGSTLPPAVVRAPEIARRTVAWRLTAPDGQWRRNGELSRARHNAALRGPLDIVAADIWWLLEGDQRDWQVLARERFGGSDVSELDLEDLGGEERAGFLHALYEAYRTADFNSHVELRGGPAWLAMPAHGRLFPMLAELVDGDNPERVAAVLHDLERVDLGPILGFKKPRFTILIRQKRGEWRFKVIQVDCPRGRGLPCAEWPAATRRGEVERVSPLVRRSATLAWRNVTFDSILNENSVTPVTQASEEKVSDEEGIDVASAAEEAAVVACVTSVTPETALALLAVGGTLELHGAENPAIRWQASDAAPRAAVEWAQACRVIVTSDVVASGVLPLTDPSTVVITMASAARITGSVVPTSVGPKAVAEMLSLGARVFVQTPATERDILDEDGIINARGFAIDVELARALAEVGNEFAVTAQTGAGVASGDVSDPRRLKAALAEAGLDVADVQRGTLEAAADRSDLSDDARQIIDARIATASNTTSKLAAALDAVRLDGRVRGTLVYAGAHTGRWTGRGFQPQNLPHGLETDVEPIIAAVMAHDVKKLKAHAKRLGVAGVPALLRSLVRSIIVAKPGHVLVAGDFAQVEPRILAWLAGDDAKLALFREGTDVYRAFAAPLLGVAATDVTAAQRRLGKVGELGCGYGMSADRAEEYGETLGVEWSKSALTAQAVVRGWRAANPLVAGASGLWSNFELAFGLALEEDHELGRVSFEGDGPDVLVELPSTRKLRYRNVESVVDAQGRTQISYEQKGRRVRTWGAKLVENIVQAIGRDLLGDALVRLERKGLPPVLHVHDEVVVEVPQPGDATLVERLLVEPPSWATGLPLAAEVTVGRRYS